MHCLTFRIEPPQLSYPCRVVYVPLGFGSIEDLEDDFRDIFRADLTTKAVFLVTLNTAQHDAKLREAGNRLYRKVINPNAAELRRNTFRLKVNSRGVFALDRESRNRLAGLLELTAEQLMPNLLPAMTAGFSTYLVSQRPIVLRASDSRFSKPSGRTSDFFIHAANAMSDSRDVEFMSLFILPMVTGSITRVYVDTVVIAPVVYSALLLRSILRPTGVLLYPTVESYHSYEGLRNGFRMQTTLARVLVSASTSGGMRDELVSRFKFPAANISTLFGPAGPTVAALFGLPIDIKQAAPARHATRLLLGGEMFWPEAQPPALMDLVLRDRPNWLARFGSAFFHRNAIRCHFSSTVHQSNKDAVFVAVDRAWRTAKFRQEVTNYLTQVLPLRVGVIVWSDDTASERIARHVLDTFYRRRGVQMISENDLARGTATPIKPPSGTIALVIGSVVASGRSFLKISQSLRNVKGLAGITYVSLLNRFSSPLREQYIRANLLQGARPGEYLWHVWQIVQLPDCSDVEALSFEKEARFLREQFTHLENSPYWEGRRQTIEAATAFKQAGLADKCFLPSFKGKALELRPGFALYQSDQLLSQAEVFAVTVAYLSNARTRALDADSSSFLVGGTLLDPSVLTRYNDGVLHAAILRACHPSELDYSTRRTESADMRNLLIGFLHTARQNSGEAAGEFLLALAMRRLRLWSEDYVVLRSAVATEYEGWPEHYAVLWRYILRDHDLLPDSLAATESIGISLNKNR